MVFYGWTDNDYDQMTFRELRVYQRWMLKRQGVELPESVEPAEDAEG